MKKQQVQELAPIVAVIFAVLSSLILAILSLRWMNPIISLLGLAVYGVLGVLISRLPLIEYLLAFALTLFLCFLILPQTHYIIALPGVAAGYFWGCFFGDLLDKPNIERARKSALEEKTDL